MSNRNRALAASVAGALALVTTGGLAQTTTQAQAEVQIAGDSTMTNATKPATLKVPGATLY